MLQVQLLSVRVHRELERPLHSSASLSEDSKNEWGPCEELSTLSPNPEDKLLLLRDRKTEESKWGNPKLLGRPSLFKVVPLTVEST